MIVMDQRTIQRLQSKLDYAEQLLQAKNEVIAFLADANAMLNQEVGCLKDQLNKSNQE